MVTSPMQTFKQYLFDGIHDKGILKAVFVVGIPGAGKSYTIKQLGGTISPKVVNIDKATEFLSRKFKMASNDQTWHSFFKDRTRPLTTEMLYQYLNGLLPLFVDGTSNDTSNILGRSGVLESLGYDVGMVFINTDLEHALERAKKRGEEIDRHVNPDFIKKVHDVSEANREYFRGKFHFFKEVANNPGELNDEAMQKLFKSVSSFYSGKVENPVGQRMIEKLKDANEKYLVPTVYDEEGLRKKVSSWYR